MIKRLDKKRGERLERRLVWMFGSPRSGSTWLLKLLAEHSETMTINEPQVGSHLAPIMSDWPGVRPGDLGLDNFTWPRMASDVSSYFFAERHAAVWRPLLAELIRERFRVHARGSALVVIKEPNGTQAADLILRTLPRSRFLFLLRDGRDVVDSELDAYTRGSWMSRQYPFVRGIDDSERIDFIAQSAHKWLWRTELCEELMRSHPGPRHQVRYEDLRSDPVSHLSELFGWLGLDPPDLVALVERHAFERSEARGRAEFTRSAKPGGWRDNLTGAEQELLESVVGEKVRALGYA